MQVIFYILLVGVLLLACYEIFSIVRTIKKIRKKKKADAKKQDVLNSSTDTNLTKGE